MERVREQVRDVDARGYSKPYAMAVDDTASRDERARTGKVVIKASERPYWVDRMAARCRFYLNHYYEDTVNPDWRMFIHDIVTQSGSHRHQGGLALFVIEGKGATYMNGVKYEWEKGDLILLPVVPGEIEHQHINYSGNAKWISFIYLPVWRAVASTLTQITDRKDWDGATAAL